jgi:type IV pilus assembly protein PilV
MAASSNFTVTVKRATAGFTMLEILVSILVIALGLLGLAGLQTRMQQAEFESYQRAQALVALYSMVDRVKLNRATMRCFAITTDTAAGAPYFGTGSSTLPACTVSASAGDNTMANTALAEIDGMLKGSAEMKGGTAAGAIIGARGCVSYDSATELLDGATPPAAIAGTGIYTAAVAWQGLSATTVPASNCAKNLYSAETQRRVVSTTFRRANLR